MADVQLIDIQKYYGSTMAVEDVNLSVADGEFLVLLGPSGCGKSTTLRMVAGLEGISGGSLRIGGQAMNRVDPKDRGVAMVFQNYALYPHKTVAENMGMALKMKGVKPTEITQRVNDVAEMLDLMPYLARKPGALSGGQRQRVAIGRAIVRTPDVFLFDEPLSNLDAKLRVRTRTELQKLHKTLGVTSIYVTHDQIEAMTLADRIVVMNKGRIAQVGTPRDVYEKPRDVFVAGFIGSPAMNLIEIGTPSATGWNPLAEHHAHIAPQKSFVVGLRGEHIALHASDTTVDRATHLAFEGKVVLTELLGADGLVTLNVQGTELLVRVDGNALPHDDIDLVGAIALENVHLFDAGELGQRIETRR